ncbi:MAG: GNAT family N-acetyltransferase [Ruminococcaceae bacterium]|nr:GNAT family N-acetyltransferase [Oscillospiraceae bacterium]
MQQICHKNNITCNYTPFNFIAKEENKVVGIITGHAYYKEIHISDLIVLEDYRNKHIGTKLVETVESYYKNKGFKNINLSTYNFQAPEFYKKSGFSVEFIRENKENQKLSKYFLVKYI